MVEYKEVYAMRHQDIDAVGGWPPKYAAMPMSESGRYCPEARLPCR